jgi:hypothetical protein
MVATIRHNVTTSKYSWYLGPHLTSFHLPPRPIAECTNVVTYLQAHGKMSAEKATERSLAPYEQEWRVTGAEAAGGLTLRCPIRSSTATPAVNASSCLWFRFVMSDDIE